jgi:hypothetical protein
MRVIGGPDPINVVVDIYRVISRRWKVIYQKPKTISLYKWSVDLASAAHCVDYKNGPRVIGGLWLVVSICCLIQRSGTAPGVTKTRREDSRAIPIGSRRYYALDIDVPRISYTVFAQIMQDTFPITAFPRSKGTKPHTNM